MLKHLGTCPLETPRLLLRRFTTEDAPAMLANWASSAEVTRYLTWPPHADLTVTQAVLRAWVADYERPEQYRWAIVLKQTGEVIGSLGGVEHDDRVGKIEAGYCLGKPWWGRGLMTEALSAAIAFWFDRVGYQRVEALHDVNNPASGAVMAKCGMAHEGIHRRAGRNNQGLCDLACWAVLKQRNSEQ